MDLASPRKTSRVKRGFHHGNLREALIAEGTRTVERLGHDQLSLRPLAKKLRVTQPAIYRHFRSREALLAAIAQGGWLRLQAVLGDALRSPGDGFVRVRAVGRAYVQWAHAHPHLFRLLSSRVPSEQRQGPGTPLPPTHYYEGLAGVVPIDDAQLADAFRAAWGLAHGLAIFVVERVFQLVDTDEERLAAAYGAIDAFVDMMRARWGSPHRGPRARAASRSQLARARRSR